MDLIRRASILLTGLVVAVIGACALVHVVAMLFAYGVMLVQGEAMAIHPGILAGALWVGAMQGASVLPVAVPLGALLHFALMRTGRTGLLPYLGAALVVAAASTVYLGIFNGFAFNLAFATMAVASAALGGCMFWLSRRPDRDARAFSTHMPAAADQAP